MHLKYIIRVSQFFTTTYSFTIPLLYKESWSYSQNKKTTQKHMWQIILLTILRAKIVQDYGLLQVFLVFSEYFCLHSLETKFHWGLPHCTRRDINQEPQLELCHPEEAMLTWCLGSQWKLSRLHSKIWQYSLTTSYLKISILCSVLNTSAE